MGRANQSGLTREDILLDGVSFEGEKVQDNLDLPVSEAGASVEDITSDGEKVRNDFLDAPVSSVGGSSAPDIIETIVNGVVESGDEWRLPTGEEVTFDNFTISGVYENDGNLTDVRSSLIVTGDGVSIGPGDYTVAGDVSVDGELNTDGVVEVGGQSISGDGVITGDGTITEEGYN